MVAILARLADAGLVVPRAQGRHRYFRPADERIAHALEALSLVAERPAGDAKWQQGAYRPLKHARTCYCHLAGELGVALLDGLLRRSQLAPGSGCFAQTAPGAAALADAGVALPDRLPGTETARRRFAYPCLDWSGRRDHLAVDYWSANDDRSACPASFSAAAAFFTTAPMPKNSWVTPV